MDTRDSTSSRMTGRGARKMGEPAPVARKLEEIGEPEKVGELGG